MKKNVVAFIIVIIFFVAVALITKPSFLFGKGQTDDFVSANETRIEYTTDSNISQSEQIMEDSETVSEGTEETVGLESSELASEVELTTADQAETMETTEVQEITVEDEFEITIEENQEVGGF